MSWTGLAPWLFVSGLAALSAAVVALHMLRVRLRRVEVDTLLFFGALASQPQRRELLGRPARWPAFLLAMLLMLALWSAFAELRLDRASPSTAVVVAVDGGQAGLTSGGETRLAALLTRAHELAHAGLGSRGAVYAATQPAVRLWQSGEASGDLASRASELRASGPSHVPSAVAMAMATLQDGDQVLVLGECPSLLAMARPGIRVLQEWAPAAENIGVTRLRYEVGEVAALWIECCAADGTVLEGLCEGRVVASWPASAPAHWTPLPSGALGLRLSRGGEVLARLEFPELTSPEIAVRLMPGIPRVVSEVVAADGLCRIGATGICVQTEQEAVTASSLVICSGSGLAARQPRCTDACPLPLSLRDRRRSAPALLREPDAVVWVEDAQTGAALVDMRVVDLPSGPVAVVRCVDWLLDDPAQRDVPVLVAGSIRWLAGQPRVTLGAVGADAALQLPLGVADSKSGAIASRRASATVQLTEGSNEIRAKVGPPRIAHGYRSVAAAPAPSATTPALGSVVLEPGMGNLLPWLLGLGLVAALLDLVLYRRGRLP